MATFRSKFLQRQRFSLTGLSKKERDKEERRTMLECNRDEATRAKDIAERKFTAKDIAAAKKFALKAHNLHPGLEGISQMISTFDVYLASENKISGEVDWYAILNVNANADDDTVKKQYRKLALTLHPDKNKSIGAEGAFKLLSEAWSVLSDKTRRSTYDQKRNNVKAHQQKAQQQNKNSSTANTNGFGNFAKTGTASNARPPKNAARTTPTAAPAPSRPVKPNTFWTACNRCKMQYEYLRVYLNHNLLCPNCHEPFLAVETATPANGSNASVTFSFPQQRQQNANSNLGNKNAHAVGRNTSAVPNVGYTHHANFQWGPFSRTAGIASATASSSAAAQAANVVHHTYEKVRREREEAQAAARREESQRKKSSRRTASGSSAAPHSNAASSSNVVDRERTVARAERAAKRRRGMEEDGDGLIRDPSLFEARTLLMEKARMEIRKKLNEWSLAAAAKVAEKEKATAVINVDACHPKISDAALNNKEPKKADSNTAPRQPVSIVVPNPDFHEFDNDRTEASFEANQVWAAYDDDDGMPRFYALIHKVVSLKPFKMRFSWLNSKTNSELGPLNWVASGFTKTCGEFRVGRYELNNNVNIFSHRARWEKGTRGVVKIMPKKGDIWALYRHWSPDWSETTPNAVIHKYDMVEVLEDYSEEGVSVTPLVKVAGFKTVFRQHPDPAMVTRIPREEMFRFSHQVPSWLLTGEEAENAPKGCRELDPAATPLELLQIITETKEQKGVENTILLHQVVTEPKEAKVVENAILLHQVVTEPKEAKAVENAEHLQVETEITEHLQVATEIKEEKVVENTKLLQVEVETREEKVVENAELPQVTTQLREENVVEIEEENVVEIKEEKVAETAEQQQ